MITVYVQIDLPQPQPRDEVIAAFEASAPNYDGTAGLQRKYYLYDGKKRVGGFYVWTERALAEALHSEDWLKKVSDRYGATAEITYFEVPVLVDNEGAMK